MGKAIRQARLVFGWVHYITVRKPKEMGCYKVKGLYENETHRIDSGAKQCNAGVAIRKISNK